MYQNVYEKEKGDIKESRINILIDEFKKLMI